MFFYDFPAKAAIRKIVSAGVFRITILYFLKLLAFFVHFSLATKTTKKVEIQHMIFFPYSLFFTFFVLTVLTGRDLVSIIAGYEGGFCRLTS